MSPPLSRALLCVTEDWFLLSHFRPVVAALCDIAREVVVVTHDNGRLAEIEALGARVLPFDFARGSAGAAGNLTVARKLADVIRAERPELIHLVSLKPIVVGAAALALAPVPRRVVHVTGLGALSLAETVPARITRGVVHGAIRFLLRGAQTHLLVENRDDLALLTGAPEPGLTASILPGAGVDAAVFSPHPRAPTRPIRAISVSRMIKSKGLRITVAAIEKLRAQGHEIALDLYGPIDAANPAALDPAEIADWQARGLATWHGATRDVAGALASADMFVLATRGGEGLPRALLEAAAMALPLIVTAVPGCRDFVRDGVEGLVVPPGDVPALAGAMVRLAQNDALRRRLGDAARARILAGFTIDVVRRDLDRAYRTLL